MTVRIRIPRIGSDMETLSPAPDQSGGVTRRPLPAAQKGIPSCQGPENSPLGARKGILEQIRKAFQNKLHRI